MLEKPTYEELEKKIRELEQAAEALRESEAQFRTLFENSPVGIGVADQQGNLLLFNDAMLKPGGYSASDIHEMGNVSALYHDPEQREEALKRFREQGFLKEFPVQFKRKDGSHYDALCSLASIHFKGQPCVQAIVEDITERKHAEKALWSEREQLLSIFDSIDEIIYISDPNTYEILYANKALKDAFQKDLVGGLCYREFQGFDALCNFVRIFIDLLQLKQKYAPYHWEYHNPVLDKDYAIIDRIIKWPDGRDVRFELAINITDRKRAEEVRRESEEKYRRIFENSVVGFFQSTPEGRFITVNPAFAEMLGYESPDELISQISDIARQYYVNPEDRHRYQQLLQKAGTVENFEFKAKCKDGSQIWVSNSTRAYFDKGGNVDRYEGIVINITERIQAEEALRESESKLRQAQKMESIGTLAGGIAHEFNNVLGIILGNTELAIDDVPEWNPAKECLKEIRAASIRAKDVVRQILSFARKSLVHRIPIQISTIIRDSLKLMRASIPTTIEIRQNISCETEMILADPTEINQILMNLCTNAVHSMVADGDVLEVSLESISLDKDSAGQYENLNTGNFVKLTVKDTGQGIDPKVIDRIFDPYFTTKDIGKGTGMGLAVAYGIVKKHDGAIKANSELGTGTVVEVLFPLIEEVVEPEVKEEPQVLPTGTERILFVDDEISLAKMVEQMLERLGYQVVKSTKPKEALALFEAEADQFDLVITDMAMPQMAGDRLAQELMEIRKDIPVILCTGHSARIDEERAKELDLAAYVMKPLVTRDLANTVRKVLDEAK